MFPPYYKMSCLAKLVTLNELRVSDFYHFIDVVLFENRNFELKHIKYGTKIDEHIYISCLNDIFYEALLQKSNPYSMQMYESLDLIVKALQKHVTPMGYNQFLNEMTIQQVVKSSLLLSESHIESYSAPLDIDNWVDSRKRNLPFFIGSFLGKVLVGQIAMSVVGLDTYKAFLSCAITEDDIVAEDIIYKNSKFQFGYLSTFSLMKNIRNEKNIAKLLMSFYRNYEIELSKGFKLEKIFAIAATPQGEKLCKLLNMCKVGATTNAEPIYEAPPETIFSSKIMTRFRKA